MTRPAPSRAHGAALVAAAHGQRRTLHQIMAVTGLEFLTAAECMAVEVGAGRMRVHDDDRTHVWLEVLWIAAGHWSAVRKSAA